MNGGKGARMWVLREAMEETWGCLAALEGLGKFGISVRRMGQETGEQSWWKETAASGAPGCDFFGGCLKYRG